MFLSEQWSILNYLFQKNLNCQQKYKIETVTFFSFVVIRVWSLTVPSRVCRGIKILQYKVTQEEYIKIVVFLKIGGMGINLVDILKTLVLLN